MSAPLWEILLVLGEPRIRSQLLPLMLKILTLITIGWEEVKKILTLHIIHLTLGMVLQEGMLSILPLENMEVEVEAAVAVVSIPSGIATTQMLDLP